MSAASSHMNTRRRTTVHDLAALRLHRDGTRVANSDSNSSSRRAKYAIRDARGNWVAKDAGGTGTVKQRHAASRPEGEQAEDDGNESEPDADEERMEQAEEDASPKVDKGKGKGRARESGDEEEIAMNARAQKRRRFDEDFSYLDPNAPPALIPSLGEDPQAHPAGYDSGTLPVPSADLLKCLHYFASTYYAAMGQLYDASREFRKERKTRRAQKLKKSAANNFDDSQSTSQEPDDQQDNPDEEDIEFSEDEEDGDETNEEGNEEARNMKGGKRRPRASRHIEKDMYKLFDGSALMALGMLLQEHVAELLQPNIPDGWEKEFALAERDRNAAEKRARRARQMWNQRHTVKTEGSEQPEAQYEGEDEQAQPHDREETLASSSSDSSESGDDE